MLPKFRRRRIFETNSRESGAQADRCTVFMLDLQRGELWSVYPDGWATECPWDEGEDVDEDEGEEEVKETLREKKNKFVELWTISYTTLLDPYG